MKYFLCLVLTVYGLYGCRNGAVDQPKTDTSLVAAPMPGDPREQIIQALQQLQKDMAGRHPETIAGYIRFPVDNDILQAFDVNTTFEKDLEQHNQIVTRELFLKHFNDLYTNLEMQGIADALGRLPLARLKDTSELQVEAKAPGEACTHFYNVSISGQEITIGYGVYNKEASTDEQIAEGLDCPEYAALWRFVLDGQKLVFRHHQVAG